MDERAPLINEAPPKKRSIKVKLAIAVIALLVIVLLVLGCVYWFAFKSVSEEGDSSDVDCTQTHPQWNSYPPYQSVDQAGMGVDISSSENRGSLLLITYEKCAVASSDSGQIYRLPDYVRTLTFDTVVESSFSSSATASASSFASVEAERVSNTVETRVGFGYNWFGISVGAVSSQDEAVLDAHTAYKKEFSFITKVNNQIASASVELEATNIRLSPNLLDNLLRLSSEIVIIPRTGRTSNEEKLLQNYLLLVSEYGTHFIKKASVGGIYISQFTHQRERMEEVSLSAESIGSCLAAEAAVGFSWGLSFDISTKHQNCVKESQAKLQKNSYAQASTNEELYIRGGSPQAAGALSIKGANKQDFSNWMATIRDNPTLLSSEHWSLSDLLTTQMLHPSQAKKFSSSTLEALRQNIHLAIAEYLDKRNPEVVCKSVCNANEVAYLDSALRCSCEKPYTKKLRVLYSGGHGELLSWIPEQSSTTQTQMTGYSTFFDVSSDGTQMAIVSGYTLYILDPITFKKKLSFSLTVTNLDYVVFSRDGKKLATSSGSKIYVLDPATGKITLTLSYTTVLKFGRLAFSPDGTRLASSDLTNFNILVWDVSGTTGKLVLTLSGHTDEVNGLGYSPDGTRIVSGGSDFKIKVWNAQLGGGALFTLSRHTAKVNDVGYSPDGSKIISAGYDKVVIIWDALLVNAPSIALTHPNIVWSAVYSPDGLKIATASSNGEKGVPDARVRIWDLAKSTLTHEKELFGHTNVVKKVLYDPVRY